MKKLAGLLTALAIVTAGTAAVSTLSVVNAPKAHAAVSIVWFVNYGNALTATSPNVWSNRNPTWKVGTNPSLTAQTDGNLVDRASFCPNGVCWASNTSHAGPGPWQFYWDSRYATSGDFRIYSSEGVIRFHTRTSGWLKAKMALFTNGCLNVYGGDYGSWGFPIWSNSASSACNISL
jgi:hypothetical protein